MYTFKISAGHKIHVIIIKENSVTRLCPRHVDIQIDRNTKHYGNIVFKWEVAHSHVTRKLMPISLICVG